MTHGLVVTIVVALESGSVWLLVSALFDRHQLAIDEREQAKDWAENFSAKHHPQSMIFPMAF